MLDEARNIKARFMNNGDVYDVATQLHKEGYTIMHDIHNDITIDGKVVYRIYVFKKDVMLVQVLYTTIFDDNKKTYLNRIYTILY